MAFCQVGWILLIRDPYLRHWFHILKYLKGTIFLIGQSSQLLQGEKGYGTQDKGSGWPVDVQV